ncbi:S-adenosyl-L-methionine-dependent methyltransferase [Tricladium varicosporioides]|nr:S-adenosyl-L-methionine-dependent methyltransferase [Hymenoscyphus varicosporioides]
MVKEELLRELAYPKYWDERYREESTGLTSTQSESFEWFRHFTQLQPFFEKHLPPSSSGCQILHLGCGKSTLTADLHALGYTQQISVDFSQVVIEAMKLKYADLQTLWEVMDVRELRVPTRSIDVAIDKGMLDTFLHGSVRDPPEDVQENVGKYVDEVARVLKPGGRWLYITYQQPFMMEPLLERKDKWDLVFEALDDEGGAFPYSGFTMTRHRASTA